MSGRELGGYDERFADDDGSPDALVRDRLVAAGVERAVVNVHYLADQLEAHLREAATRQPQHLVTAES